ncbi:hypothetical protein NQ314_013786, partial [Rhamnusium bicolor]
KLISLFYFSALANSTRCYACNGEYCNDPFNRDRANIMMCSNNLQLTDPITQKLVNRDANDDSSMDEWDSLESKLLKDFRIFFEKNNEFVCVTTAYYHNIHLTNMTIRRCMPKSYKNMDPCTYLSNTIHAGYGTVRKCATCDTDLCNSGINLKNSILTIFYCNFSKIIILMFHKSVNECKTKERKFVQYL